MNYQELWDKGLSYADFLSQHANPGQQQRWASMHDQLQLTDAQKTLLKSFKRKMHVFIVAGAWCGDCVDQCPIFDRIASENENVQVHFFDRDVHPELASELSVCGGNRVPAVLFVSEDWHPTGRYGDKTLAKYRSTVNYSGEACSIGLAKEDDPLAVQITAEWVEQFERNQYILRTSSRLRQMHGD